MRNGSFNTKIKIEALEKTLSEDNRWISVYKPWREVWAFVSLRDISSKRALYLFAVRRRNDFPREFRIVIKDKIFMPTQPPTTEPSRDLILFHAVVK
ncbi:MAG: hypothetical protein LBO73_04845 [Holosporaceae bacterium]|jgi:hypothetical protein|nr:hypothetical protein [Holosporaceae bacterium]